MFRRFTPEEDVLAKTAIKSSAIRAIKASVVEQFPAAEAYIDDVVPKKATVLEGKGWVGYQRAAACRQCAMRGKCGQRRDGADVPLCADGTAHGFTHTLHHRKDKLTFVIVDNEILFFRQRDGPYYPTLRVLHKCASARPRALHTIDRDDR